jgi:hypothetical protein
VAVEDVGFGNTTIEVIEFSFILTSVKFAIIVESLKVRNSKGSAFDISTPSIFVQLTNSYPSSGIGTGIVIGTPHLMLLCAI